MFDRIKNFDKTKFALGLMTERIEEWRTPAYITQGLEWLQGVLALTDAQVVDVTIPVVTEVVE